MSAFLATYLVEGSKPIRLLDYNFRNSFKLDLLGDSFINSMLFRSLPNYFSY